MKKLALIWVTLSLLTGCSSVTPKMGVVDNVFYSTVPELILKVDPGFTLVDTADGGEPTGDVGPDKTIAPSQKERLYIFVRTGGERIIDKLITIQIASTESGSKENFSQQQKDDSLQWGNERLGSRGLIFRTYAMAPSSGDQLSDMMKEKGYPLPCGLYKESKGIIGSSSDLLRIGYYENISGLSYACSSWSKKELLTLGQKYHLAAFKQRSKAYFEILDYDSNIGSIFKKEK